MTIKEWQVRRHKAGMVLLWTTAGIIAAMTIAGMMKWTTGEWPMEGWVREFGESFKQGYAEGRMERRGE